MKLFADFIVSNPEEAWKNAGKSQVDPVAEGRAKIVAKVDEALAQLASGEENPKRGLYKTKADMAQVTIRAGREIVPIDGKERNVVPVAKLAEFFNVVKMAVDRGHFDAQLGGKATEGVEKKPRKRTEMTEEAKAQRSAKMKAAWAKRKAEKA